MALPTTPSSGTRIRRAGGALFAVLLASCSSAGGGGGGGGRSDMITREQILELADGTALMVVQRYRSQWLRPRSQGTFGATAPDMPQVFVDELHYGGVDSLSRILSTNIESIQFISAANATTRYGTGYSGGIIRVNTIVSN